MKQTTLQNEVHLSGRGLHTGVEVTMTFCPAPANHGYKFQRIDLPGKPIIDALAEYVVDTSRGTTIEFNGARVNTVEHVLAALVGSSIDNALIQINGIETPIMDGSSRYFTDKLKEAGIVELDADREYLELTDTVTFEDQSKGIELSISPHKNYELNVTIDYNSKVLGEQTAQLTSMSDFTDSIGPCRTFCFLHEIEMLVKHNLIKGGDLDNAIVIVDRVVEQDSLDELAKLLNKPSVEVKDTGILNNIELRFDNEPARHKLLDMIGDLALVGKPIKGFVKAKRPGHASNVALAKMIRAQQKTTKNNTNMNEAPHYDPNREPIFNYQQIEKILPHSFPFLLVDKVIEISDKSIVGIKNITGDQYFFQGHFQGEPLMPGVLQLEAMAQAGGVLVLHDKEDPSKWSTYFVKIENAKFKGKVVPGDSLIIKMELTAPIRRGLCAMRGTAYVGSKLVCEANMMAQIVENK